MKEGWGNWFLSYRTYQSCVSVATSTAKRELERAVLPKL